MLLVFGGSLGAHALNVAVLEAFAEGETPFQVVHVTGERDYAWVAETLAEPGANPSYQAHAFLDDLPLALAAADAVVARAGGSVAEILARGVPALLVPYPYAAGDHQAKNAGARGRSRSRPGGRQRRTGQGQGGGGRRRAPEARGQPAHAAGRAGAGGSRRR